MRTARRASCYFVIAATVFTSNLTTIAARQDALSYSVKNIDKKNNIVHVAVIGSGAAGLSAAVYTARAGFHTVVFGSEILPSQLSEVSLLENWPGVDKKSGGDILKDLHQQAEHFGAHIVPLSVKSIDVSQWPFVVTTDNDDVIHAYSIIIATGAVPKKLGIPGEDEYWGKGLANCVKCDAPLTKNQRVVIVGSNDPSIEYAIQLSPYTKDITIMLKENSLQATAYKQTKLAELSHVKLDFGKQIEEVVGNGNEVTGLKVRDVNSGEQSLVATNWLFLAVGSNPRSELFKGRVSLDAKGYIKTYRNTQETNVNGVFTAGTVSDARYKQASVASGDGARAGLDANAFLFGLDERTIKLSKNKLYKKSKK